jgi:indole-3-glycerol phosphate synthase
MSILEKIIAAKLNEVKHRKEMIPEESYMGLIGLNVNRPSFSNSLKNSVPSIIAEFKRKSPSKGIINMNAKLYETISGYGDAGVKAISVLTDNEFFGGSLCDMQDASVFTAVPILRKDFIIDAYQITEARAFGASAILLIASILTPREIQLFTLKAIELGMDVLFEVHDESELDKACGEISIIGVNNRNLGTFQVSIDNSVKILDKIPPHCIKVAESGITECATVIQLYKAGFDAFLIGEAFMNTEMPWKTAAEFISKLNDES